MERVSEENVLAHWLSVLSRAPSSPDIDIEGMGPRAMLDALLRREPAAYVLWQAQPITWYHLDLTRAELERLRVVEGPPDMGWRALTSANTIGAVATYLASDPPAPAVRGVDIEWIRSLADDVGDDESTADLVLATRRGCSRPYVVDGNHRAVALALRAMRTGQYEPVGAYLGVGPTPVLGPVWRRICGVISRLRPDRGGPRW